MAGIDEIPAMPYPDMQSERFAPGAPKAAGLFRWPPSQLEKHSRFQVMAHGGPRLGAGRKPGAATKLNEEARKQAAEGGLMPLDYLLSIMRDEELPRPDRVDAAKAAAPYVHAKLSAVEHKGGLEVTTQTKEQRDAAVAAASRADS